VRILSIILNRPAEESIKKKSTTAHYRPCSPGLKGKTITPAYTASMMTMSKVATMPSFSKMKGINIATKGKEQSLNIASAIDYRATSFVRPSLKHKWK